MDCGRPFIVGIVGPSSSGKSSLASELDRRLGNRSMLCPEDASFFKSVAASYRDRDFSTETPGHIAWDDYVASLHGIIEAASASNHNVVIVEHFLLLHDKRVSDLLNGLVFLDPEYSRERTEEEVMHICMERRVQRSPNRSEEEALYLRRYYENAVWPCYKKYCRDQVRGWCKAAGYGNDKKVLKVDCIERHVTDISDEVETSVKQWTSQHKFAVGESGRL